MNPDKHASSYEGRKVLSSSSIKQPPRIDISCASSFSQQGDSRDSSPENVFDQVGTGTLQENIESITRHVNLMKAGNDDSLAADELCKELTQHETKSTQGGWPKIDEQLSCLSQNARKDSISSEVAALLCISGRTSRISSVGSQGSAISRVSGVSRSPSPHKMLLETSFCGPKPINNDVLITNSNTKMQKQVEIEQILVARNCDFTQAVFIGEPFDGTKSKENNETSKKLSNTNSEKLLSTMTEKSFNKISQKGGVLKKNKSAVVGSTGVTQGGTEYIRIRLKEDYLYDDEETEKVIEKDNEIISNSLRIKTTKVVNNENENSLSEENCIRQSFVTQQDNSRSPSPAFQTRKNSFCSLFKSKESTGNVTPQKNDRSQSKNKEQSSTNSTPSKQRSVLTIFKPRRHSSKSPSPVDQEGRIIDMQVSLKQENKKSMNMSHEQSQTAGRITPRLRYYETPVDGNIYIPLHTPPDEKEIISICPHTSTAKDVMSTSSNILTKQSRKVEEEAVIIEAQDYEDKLKENDGKSIGTSCESTLQENVKESRDISRDYDDVMKRRCLDKAVIHSADKTISSGDAIFYSAEDALNVSEQEIQENQTTSVSEYILGTVKLPKERKRILFSTKIGSGSDEQIFATQLSLSKTESLSSQLSEQPNLESPTKIPKSEKSRLHKHDSDTIIVEEANSKIVSSDAIDLEKSSIIVEKNDNIQKNDREEIGQITMAECISADKPDTCNVFLLEDAYISSKYAQSLRQIGPVEEESTGLVSQDSCEGELPYVPTTLPEERTLGVPLLPIRQRTLMDLNRTLAVDRPRPVTPVLNPLFLENYCGSTSHAPNGSEKIKISLPSRNISKSRCFSNAKYKNWLDFAEKEFKNSSQKFNLDLEGSLNFQNTSTSWIDFDRIPEKRKPTKRITTIPQKTALSGQQVQYNYVNTEECSCECHHGNDHEASNAITELYKSQSPELCTPLIESDSEEHVDTRYESESFDDSDKPTVKTESEVLQSSGNLRSSKTTTVQWPQRLQP